MYIIVVTKINIYLDVRRKLRENVIRGTSVNERLCYIKELDIT